MKLFVEVFLSFIAAFVFLGGPVLGIVYCMGFVLRSFGQIAAFGFGGIAIAALIAACVCIIEKSGAFDGRS